jgi:hypothetical protein
MKTISNQIIEAMPIGLVNEFRTKALCLISDLIEEIEIRHGALTAEEVNFFKVLQSIQGDKERWGGMCIAFGKLMYAHQVLESIDDTTGFKSRVKNQDESSGDDIPWGQE